MTLRSLWRRFAAATLCATLTLSATACSETADNPAAPAPVAPVANDLPPLTGETTTLMVYMVGSDLEAKAGAATKDLKEMAASGIDLSVNNVVVCAGGSPKWHNDVADKERLTTMHLTADGFVVDKSEESVSMGEAAPLTAFLQYAYHQYPADNFALVMWDHGMGPVIGYGKDMLFGKDALTLSEMQEALRSSPFNGDTSLAFVGFDACLMSSAELACMWDDHADYLIASQEIEPSGGWDYAFLSLLGRCDTVTLADDITSRYLTACETYFAEKGYDGREATLACMDLSQAAALETALNDLFAAADGDVNNDYADIAAKRVDTRAFGRATTGSEYDLVDLSDMATQLSARYPDETAALQTAIDALVIHNATNAEKSCGLSLYYPFFNKDHYEATWAAAYQQLGLLDSYQSFLSSYDQQWLSSDLLEAATSTAPTTDGSGRFSLELTEEQANAYASAVFYVFEKEGKELYQPLLVSAGVKKEGRSLVADFDGNMLYYKDYRGNYCVPGVTQRDTVGDVTRYELMASLSNKAYYESPSDDDAVFLPVHYHLSVNTDTDQVSVSGLVPLNDDDLAGGKTDDIRVQDYYTVELFQHGHYLATYYDNGVIRPFSDWVQHGTLTYYSGYTADIGEFMMAPLDAGEYYFMYEITDVQGNRYASDLTPFTANGTLPEPSPAPAELTVSWNSGDNVTVYDDHNVTVRLQNRLGYYGEKTLISVENRNAFDVKVACNNPVFNGNLFSGYHMLCYDFVVPAGTTVVNDNGLIFSEIDAFVDMNELTSLRFDLSLRNYDTGKAMIDAQPISVSFTEDINLNDYQCDRPLDSFDEPYLGAFAEEQLLLDTDMLEITLLRFAAESLYSPAASALFRFENTSDEDVTVKIDGCVVDGVYIPSGSSYTIPAHQVLFSETTLYDMADYAIDAIASLSFRFSLYHDAMFVGGYLGTEFCDVDLAVAAPSASAFEEGDTVVFEKDGIRIALLEHTISDYTNQHTWTFTVVNNSGKDIQLNDEAVFLDGEPAPYMNTAYISFDGIGNNQIGLMTLHYYPAHLDHDIDELSVSLQCTDFAKEEFYALYENAVTLTVDSEEGM